MKGRLFIATLALSLVAILSLTGGSWSKSAAASGISDQSPEAAICVGTPVQCFADVLPGSSFFDNANHLYEQGIVGGYACGGAGEPCDASNRPYYRGGNNVSRAQMTKFVDNARTLPGIHIDTATDRQPLFVNTTALGSTAIVAAGSNMGVNGVSAGGQGINGQSQSGTGVLGSSSTGYGVVGASTDSDGVHGLTTGGGGAGVSGTGATAGVYGTGGGVGVEGRSTNGYGVYAASANGAGVYGNSGGSDGVLGVSDASGHNGVSGVHSGAGIAGNGIYGQSDYGYAGWFNGPVRATGGCCNAGELNTQIDDPLDPANKYLNHSAVQSTQATDLYMGHVTLDADGQAVVTMPAWFDALNKDFEYQLTCIGGYAPLYIAREIADNSFTIAGGKAGMKVSWQVTGIRHDPYTVQHPTSVEQDKAAPDKGKYLYPQEYGLPPTMGVGYAQTQQVDNNLKAAK
jgi:hypothetical protein